MSFNIALTGLSAVTEQMDAISNNIANVGTTGFKSSRTEFGSIYADSQAMGVEVLGLTQSISKGGSLVSTGRELDLAIAGGGFFVTKGSTGELGYTRAGVFGTDKNNLIVDVRGERLQGYPYRERPDVTKCEFACPCYRLTGICDEPGFQRSGSGRTI